MSEKMETKEQWLKWLEQYPKVKVQMDFDNIPMPEKYPAILCHGGYKGKYFAQCVGDIYYWFLGNDEKEYSFTHYEYIPIEQQTIGVSETVEYHGECPICGSWEETEHPEADNGIHTCSECEQELKIDLE